MKLTEKSATESLHYDYCKMLKSDPYCIYCERENPIISNGYIRSIITKFISY